MPRKEDTEIVRPNASPDVLNPVNAGASPSGVGGSPTIDFSPLFPFLAGIREAIAGQANQPARRGKSQKADEPPEFTALKLLAAGVTSPQEIAALTGVHRSTVIRWTVFKTFHKMRLICPDVPVLDLPKGFIRQTGDWKSLDGRGRVVDRVVREDEQDDLD